LRRSGRCGQGGVGPRGGGIRRCAGRSVERRSRRRTEAGGVRVSRPQINRRLRRLAVGVGIVRSGAAQRASSSAAWGRRWRESSRARRCPQRRVRASWRELRSCVCGKRGRVTGPVREMDRPGRTLVRSLVNTHRPARIVTPDPISLRSRPDAARRTSCRAWTSPSPRTCSAPRTSPAGAGSPAGPSTTPSAAGAAGRRLCSRLRIAPTEFDGWLARSRVRPTVRHDEMVSSATSAPWPRGSFRANLRTAPESHQRA
jgi:hypothetical protein